MALAMWLFGAKAQAATLTNIQVNNSPSQAEVVLSFIDGKPTTLFPIAFLPERLVVDIKQRGEIIGFHSKVLQERNWYGRANLLITNTNA